MFLMFLKSNTIRSQSASQSGSNVLETVILLIIIDCIIASTGPMPWINRLMISFLQIHFQHLPIQSFSSLSHMARRDDDIVKRLLVVQSTLLNLSQICRSSIICPSQRSVQVQFLYFNFSTFDIYKS